MSGFGETSFGDTSFGDGGGEGLVAANPLPANEAASQHIRPTIALDLVGTEELDPKSVFVRLQGTYIMRNGVAEDGYTGKVTFLGDRYRVEVVFNGAPALPPISTRTVIVDWGDSTGGQSYSWTFTTAWPLFWAFYAIDNRTIKLFSLTDFSDDPKNFSASSYTLSVRLGSANVPSIKEVVRGDSASEIVIRLNDYLRRDTTYRLGAGPLYGAQGQVATQTPTDFTAPMGVGRMVDEVRSKAPATYDTSPDGFGPQLGSIGESDQAAEDYRATVMNGLRLSKAGPEDLITLARNVGVDVTDSFLEANPDLFRALIPLLSWGAKATRPAVEAVLRAFYSVPYIVQEVSADGRTLRLKGLSASEYSLLGHKVHDSALEDLEIIYNNSNQIKLPQAFAATVMPGERLYVKLWDLFEVRPSELTVLVPPDDKIASYLYRDSTVDGGFDPPASYMSRDASQPSLDEDPSTGYTPLVVASSTAPRGAVVKKVLDRYVRAAGVIVTVAYIGG